MNKYVVTTKVSSLERMNGYTCNSESKDHFLRHLGYRFIKTCNMQEINNAYECGDLSIDICKEAPIQEVRAKVPTVLNEAWTDFGYELKIGWGSGIEEIREFLNDVEAHEWLEGHIHERR